MVVGPQRLPQDPQDPQVMIPWHSADHSRGGRAPVLVRLVASLVSLASANSGELADEGGSTLVPYHVANRAACASLVSIRST